MGVFFIFYVDVSRYNPFLRSSRGFFACAPFVRRKARHTRRVWVAGLRTLHSTLLAQCSFIEDCAFLFFKALELNGGANWDQRFGLFHPSDPLSFLWFRLLFFPCTVHPFFLTSTYAGLNMSTDGIFDNRDRRFDMSVIGPAVVLWFSSPQSCTRHFLKWQPGPKMPVDGTFSLDGQPSTNRPHEN